MQERLRVGVPIAASWASLAPYTVLVSAAACVLVFEGFRGSEHAHTEPIWPILQASVAAVALTHAWRHRDSLRLGPTLGFAVAFHLAWIGLHLTLGVSQHDSAVVYPRDGDSLLSGTYPESAYPPGAVILFALDVLLALGNPDDVRVSHAFFMVPFQAVSVVAVSLLRTPSSAWWALVVGVWPLNAVWWEFRFDPAPTAALLIGVVLAYRARWTSAGIALGLGAALKWTPALTALALFVWLLASRRPREAWSHALAFGTTFIAIHLPFLVWAPAEVIGTYESQAQRGITAESLPYLPLRLFGLTSFPGTLHEEVAAPAWAKDVAVLGQAAVMVGVLLAVVMARGRSGAGIAVAALAPVAFLLTNRIFSPQFLVLIVGAWAVAAALLNIRGLELCSFVGLAAAASLANALIFTKPLPYFAVYSAILFAAAGAATLLLLLRATVGSESPPSPDAAPAESSRPQRVVARSTTEWLRSARARRQPWLTCLRARACVAAVTRLTRAVFDRRLAKTPALR